TTGGDHGHAHGVRDLRQERKCSDLRSQIFGQENAAVPTRLPSLSDNDIDTLRFKPARFLHGSGGGNYDRAPTSHAREQLGLRQTEMKTDDFGPELRERLSGCEVERPALSALVRGPWF